VLLVDDVHTLANFVIVDHIRVDLILWATFSCEVVVIIAISVKDGLYYNQFLQKHFSI